MMVVINDHEVDRLFNSIDWKIYEISAFKNYCMMSSVKDIAELTYIILSMIDEGYSGSQTEYIFNIRTSLTVSFRNAGLVNISHSFFDEVVHLIEEDVRLDSVATLSSTGERPPSSFEIEEFFERCARLYEVVMAELIGPVMDRQGHYNLDCYRGSLICMEI